MGYEFEKHRVRYTIPAKEHRYTPDFVLSNGVIVETKGRFITADRQKHLHIQRDHPDLDIRFVFSRPHTPIGSTSKTTYAMWCDRYGFKWAAKWVPLEWTKEPLTPARVTTLKASLDWEPTGSPSRS